MDPAEEQQQELEVLESIYPDEFEKISDKEFTIKILLETPSSNIHQLILHVKYPETYPDVVPELSIVIDDIKEEEEEESDDDDEDSEPAVVLTEDQVFFNNNDINKLLIELNKQAEENLGMPSIFTLTSYLKESSELLFQNKINKLEKEREIELLKQEMEENKKFTGTKVTKDSFLKWRENFRNEIGYYEKINLKIKKNSNGKLTGRELFEQGLAITGDIDDDSTNVAEITSNISKVSVS